MMGHQDQLEILDPRAPQVIVECQVSRDQADSRVHVDFEVPLGNQVNRENQVTMVHRVYRECPDLRDLQDQLVIKELRDRLVNLVRRALLDVSVTRVRLGPLVHRVFRVLPDFPVLQGHKVKLVKPVKGDYAVKQDHRVLMDRQVHEESQDHLVWMAPRVTLVSMDRRVSRVIEV